MKKIRSRRELRQHQDTMDVQLAQVEEMNTGLTTAMDQYKFSESTPFEFRQSATGPSRTQQYDHPQRLAGFQSPSVSSFRDTESASTWLGRIQGGAGNDDGADGGAAGGADNGAAGGADGGAAGGAEGGAAGGADGGAAGDGRAGGPPLPPDPPPSDHGGAGGRPMSRRQRRIKELKFAKPIKIKQPKKLYGNAGKDFDTWWVLDSVSNWSGPSLRVRVRVGTEPEPDWRSGSSINPNCQFGYSSIAISLPV